MFEKLKTRTELQVTLISILIVALNSKLGLGLTETEIAAIAGLVGSYALSRGLAKKESPV